MSFRLESYNVEKDKIHVSVLIDKKGMIECLIVDGPKDYKYTTPENIPGKYLELLALKYFNVSFSKFTDALELVTNLYIYH